MKIGKLTSALSLATLLLAAPAVAAEVSTETSASTLSGSEDFTGMSTIGIDITNIGRSPSAVEQYLATLNPEGLRSVISGCSTAVANAAGYHPDVVGFCSQVNSIGGSGNVALGFAPVEPRFGLMPTDEDTNLNPPTESDDVAAPLN